MIKFPQLSGWALAAALAFSASGAGAAVFSKRFVLYQLDTYSGLASTVTKYDNIIVMPEGGGNAIGANLSLKTGATGVYFETTGAVSTTFAVPPLGTPNVVGDVLNATAGGLFEFGYVTHNGPDFAKSWTKSEVKFGRHVLHFNGGGTNFADLGAVFSDDIFISGDWSVLGTAAGNHTGLSYDTTHYSLINDFVYNASLNVTQLTIGTTLFPGGSPNIDFYLIGGPADVPEPGAWALMLVGFAGLGAALRQRRRGVAPA